MMIPHLKLVPIVGSFRALLSLLLLRQSVTLYFCSSGVDAFLSHAVVRPLPLAKHSNVQVIPMVPFRTAASLITRTAITEEGEAAATIPAEITTKALAQIIPAMMKHKAQYGNPNIPLGTTEGRQCSLIRSMHIQGKLTEVETNLLQDMGFIFHTLEDVYEHADFDILFARLEQYKADNNGNVNIKKKYAADPELGAWVTGIRRLGKQGVTPDHKKRLNDVQFIWLPTRQCGSKFMEQYRAIQQRLQDDNEDADKVWADPEVQKYVRAQKEAHSRKTLSETRIEYMSRLLGEEWWK